MPVISAAAVVASLWFGYRLFGIWTAVATALLFAAVLLARYA